MEPAVDDSTVNVNPALSVLDQGRSLIDAQKWEQAASAFDRFIVKYPSDKNVDAALFWLAVAASTLAELSSVEPSLRVAATRLGSPAAPRSGIGLSAAVGRRYR